jgi:hypothetical protein
MHEQREDYKHRCRTIWDKQAAELRDTSSSMHDGASSSSSSQLQPRGAKKGGKQLDLNLNRKEFNDDGFSDDDSDDDDDDDDEELESAVCLREIERQ